MTHSPLIQPIWAQNKPAKPASLKNSFLRRFSNFKLEKFDSAQANTKFFTSWPIIKLTKNVRLCSNSYPIFRKINAYSLSRQGEACTDKIDARKTPRTVSLHRLRAVLANFERYFQKNFEIISFNIWTLNSMEICLTPRSVSLNGV